MSQNQLKKANLINDNAEGIKALHQALANGDGQGIKAATKFLNKTAKMLAKLN